MPRRTVLLSILILISVFGSWIPTSPTHLPSTPPAYAETTASDSTFYPLPRACGNMLAPGTNAVCCMIGYIFIDGRPVANARVHITNLRTGRSEEVWTANGPDSDQPYYQLALSGAPLNTIVGDQIQIDTFYSTHATSQTHTVVADGQRVDVVLERHQAEDYVYDGRIWGQAAHSEFNMVLGDLAIDGSDAVYVTDYLNARIQVFNTQGQFIRSWGTLGLAPGQFQNPSGIAVDALGHVYVADYGSHRIIKYTSTGEYLTEWGIVGSGSGQLSFPVGVAVDDDGFVYVAEHGNNRIQKFTANGDSLSTWGTSGTGPGQFDGPNGVAIHNGLIYVADTSNNRIQIFTLAGNYQKSITANSLSFPERVVINANGTIVVSDSGNNRIVSFAPDGSYQGEIGSPGQGTGEFFRPGGVGFSSDGTLFVADSYNHRVQSFTPSGQFVRTWGQKGYPTNRVNSPNGIAVGPDGSVYISDSENGLIRKYTANGSYLATIGEPGGADGELNTPGGVAVDSSGNIYVADTGNHRVQVFGSSGAFLRKWGDNGTGDGQFLDPIGIAVSSDARVYVVDSGLNRLQKFDALGNFEWKLGGTAAGNGNGQFNFPRAVAIGNAGTIYVADTDNDRVQIISPTGEYIAQFGSTGGNTGQFNGPSGIAIDPNGNVYIADYNNYRIQKLSANGTPILLYGAPSATDGEFIQPTRLAVAGSGSSLRIYVAERTISRVQMLRRITYTKPIATIISTSGLSVNAGDLVTVHGSGKDSDETPAIASYIWSVDGGTPFATTSSATLNTAGLPPGTHRLELQVQDTEGETSDITSLQVFIKGASTRTWTFMLYLAGDNGALARTFDINQSAGVLYRLQNLTPNANVTVTALFDGNGAHDSVRYIFQPNGQFVRDDTINEVNTGDPQTLVDFVAWSKEHAPADAYYLSIADHANAIAGIAWDYTSDPTGQERLTNTELRQALLKITDNGAHPIDVLHFDACLMGMVEIAYQARGTANSIVASQNLAWSAFGYERYRSLVTPTTTPSDLAKEIADSYADKVGAWKVPFTIASYDMGQLNSLISHINTFAAELQRYAQASETNRAILLNLRKQVQKFASSGDLAITEADEYIDLHQWLSLVESNISDAGVKTTAHEAKLSVESFIIRNHAQSATTNDVSVELDNANGVSIYFPKDSTTRTYGSYHNELNFANDTGWDGFLQAEFASFSLVNSSPLKPIQPLDFGHIYIPQALRP